MTNLHQLTSHSIRHNAVKHGDRVVTMDYCDVTSPCFVYVSHRSHDLYTYTMFAY